VPEYSAVLDIPNEMIIPLNANHRTLCQYSSKDQNYLLVAAAIQELASQHVKVQRKFHRTIQCLAFAGLKFSYIAVGILTTAAKKADDIVLPLKAPPMIEPRNSVIHRTITSVSFFQFILKLFTYG
jgi:hypothetical protein